MLLENPRTGERIDTYGQHAQQYMVRGWHEVTPEPAEDAEEMVPARRPPGRPRKDGSWPQRRKTT